jgi:FkbM family methyltransferase
MRLRDAVIKLGAKLPLWVRWKVASSPLYPIFRQLLNWLVREELVIVPLSGALEGHRMRLNWRHHKRYALGMYEPMVVEIIAKTVKPGWVCADVGAFIGYYTLLLAKSVGATGKVIAFEPFPSNFQILCENIALNGYQNVVLENKAVMDKSQTVNFRSTVTKGLDHGVSVMTGFGMYHAVSLDDYWGNRTDRLNFVKIDVEGAEAAVLKGMERVMRRDRPILLVELHAFDQQGENHPALRCLKEFCYEIVQLPRQRGEFRGGEVHILAQPKE